jgi:hypothetical protein
VTQASGNLLLGCGPLDIKLLIDDFYKSYHLPSLVASRKLRIAIHVRSVSLVRIGFHDVAETLGG